MPVIAGRPRLASGGTRGHGSGSRKRSVGGASPSRSSGDAASPRAGAAAAASHGTSGRRRPRSASAADADDGKPTSGRRASRSASRPRRTGGWCLPEAQLAIGRHPGRPRDLRHADRARRRTVSTSRSSPTVGHAERRLHGRGRSSSVRASSSTTARRSTRRSSRTTSTPTAASTRHEAAAVHVRVQPTSTTSTVVDPLTVEVDMKHAVGRVPVVPLRATAGSASWPRRSSTTPTNCNNDMIGTGPFKFKGDWVVERPARRREEPELLAQGPVRRSSCRTSTRSRSSRSPRRRRWCNGLSSKQFDLAITDDTRSRSSQLAAERRSRHADDARVRQVPRGRYTMFNATKPPFNNINARQAFAYAVDRDEYNQLAQRRHPARNAPGPFGPGVHRLPAPTPACPTYNPAKAKAATREVQAARPARTSTFTLRTPDRRRRRSQDAQLISRATCRTPASR